MRRRMSMYEPDLALSIHGNSHLAQVGMSISEVHFPRNPVDTRWVVLHLNTYSSAQHVFSCMTWTNTFSITLFSDFKYENLAETILSPHVCNIQPKARLLSAHALLLTSGMLLPA